MHLRPKTMDLLIHLAESPGQTIDKETLLRSVWPDTIVADGGLSHCVSELRAVLGDNPRQPSFIETVPRRGYRLIASVESLEGEAAKPPRRPETQDRIALPPVAPRPTARWTALTAVALLVMALIGVAFRSQPATGSGLRSGDDTAIFGARPTHRTVVLGFANLSGDPDVGWLSEALPFLLSAELASTTQLAVVPWEVLAALSDEIPSGEIAVPSAAILQRLRDYLGVDRVISGHFSLSAADDREAPYVEITVTDADTGASLGSAQSAGRRDQLGQLTRRLVTDLRDELDWASRISGAATTGRTVEGDWLEDYFRGLRFLAEYKIELAHEHLERAAASSDSPWPHLALADLRSRTGHREQASSSIETALALASRSTGEERLWLEVRAHALVEHWQGAIERLLALRTLAPENLETDLRLASSYLASDRAEDAKTVITGALARAPAVADGPRWRLLSGEVYLALGRHDQALAEAAEAAELARELSAGGLEGRALYLEASIRAADGQAREALDSLDRARRTFAAARDLPNEAAASNILAKGLTRAGEHPWAREAADNALRISRTIGDHAGEAEALRLLGFLAWKCGRREDGERALLGALEILRHTADRAEQARVWATMAEAVHRFSGELGQPYLEEALALYRQLGDRENTGWMLFRLGQEDLFAGDLRDALATLEEAEATADALEPGRRARLMLMLGHGRLWAGDLYKARAAIEVAEQLYRQAGDNTRLATTLEHHGFARMLEADLESAIQYQRQSLSLLEELGETTHLARSRQGLARMLLETGDLDHAERLARQAVAQTAELPASDELRHLTHDTLARVQLELESAESALETLAKLPEQPISDMSFVALSAALTRARALAAAGLPQPARRLLGELAEHLDGHGPELLQLDAELEKLRLDRGLASAQDPATARQLASRARDKGLMLLAGKVESLL